MSVKNILSFLFIALSWLATNAQKPYLPAQEDPLLEPWRWKLIPELRGKGIRCIAEGNNGALWFGTDKGVSRYDGLSWTIYDTLQNKLGAAVNVLLKTKDGRMVAGTEKGLYQFTNKWEPVFDSKENKNLNILCIKSLSDNSLLVGYNLGFILISGKNISFFTQQQNVDKVKNSFKGINVFTLPNEFMLDGAFPRIDDFFEKSPTELWVLISQSPVGAIFSFNPKETLISGRFSHKLVLDIDGNPLGHRQKILQTKDKSIWIISGNYSSGIFRFKNNRWQNIKPSQLFGGDELHTDILEMEDGSLWLGGLGKLFVFRNEKWSMYEPPLFPIPYSRVIFYESKKSSVWIAGQQNEAFRFDYSQKKWKTYKNLNYQGEDKQGKKYFLSSDNKVVIQNKQSWDYYDQHDSLMDAPVRLLITSKGEIWAAGSHRSIAATARFDGKKWHLKLHPKLSWGIDYRAVFEAADGSLWFGCAVDAMVKKGQLSGVVRLLPQSGNHEIWEHYPSALLNTQANAYGFAQSVDGRIWMGGTQLQYFDGKKWNIQPQPEQLKQFINCVYSPQNGKLWAGSRFYGLFCFDGKTWKTYNTDNGLTSNSIISIFAQNDSNVWAATDNDILKFDGTAWTKGIFHNSLNMTREGGEILVSKENGIWLNKSLREWKRRAFTFNTAPEIAYNTFKTVRYQLDSLAPQTFVKVYTREVDQNGNTLISWEGIDYWADTPAEKLSYSFRMNGGEWSPFQTNTFQSFTNLPDGDYTFEVRARDGDFNVDPTPAKIFFAVLPPVWKQTWFIILVITFISSITYAVWLIMRRNRKLASLNASLQELNKELVLQKEEVLAKNEEITSHQEKIVEQKTELEISNNLLENQNAEIIAQRDKLSALLAKIEELTQAKLSFFTNISHEFRTPLTLILGPVENLLNGKVSDETNRQHLYATVQRNAMRLLRLINQLLDFRKMESGRAEISYRSGNLIEFVADIVRSFENLALQKEISLEFAPSINATNCLFDPDKLDKIVYNLLSNAFKFTPEKGKICVELNILNLTENQANTENNIAGFIEIKVKDTGIGISEEDQVHLFERFYKVKDLTLNISGTGIGLAYIKELIELMGGKISVSSQKNSGSEFSVYLPYLIDNMNDKKENEANSEKVSFTINPQKNPDPSTKTKKGAPLPKLLIVEDDYELMQYLAGNMDGFTVETARNGVEALQKANETFPDLVLSDVMMPEMDGIELCRSLKNGLLTSHIPVVLLTAKTLVEHKLEGYGTGADDYIEKPFDLGLLQARIQNLLNNRQKLIERFKKDILTDPKEVTITSTDEKLLKEVMEAIEKNLGKPDFNIEELCQQFCLSRSHFTRKIKQISGMSPIELLNGYRLKKAAQLIKQSGLSISEIAYMVGFEHPNSLSRAFKKQFGVSPSEF
jgi:signal transduction histidine kinase/AraC-like DNA-binding protein